MAYGKMQSFWDFVDCMRPLIMLLLATVPFTSQASVVALNSPLVLTPKERQVGARLEVAPPLALPPFQADLDTYTKAIASGVAKVVFLGDSITEGVSQIRYRDSWAGRLSESLRLARPDVRFEFSNLSLAGRGIAQLANPNYRAIQGVDNPPVGFHRDPAYEGIPEQWPAGSVDGLSWIDQVKAAKPDLVILAFGMNDRGNSGDIARLTKQVIKELQSFDKKPSLALVTPILPTRKVKYYDEIQDTVQTTADVYRSLSKELNLTLLDANWRYRLLRDGQDIRSLEVVSHGLSEYPKNFRKRSGYGFELQGTVLYGYGSLEHLVSIANLDVTSAFILNDYKDQTASVWYRVDRRDPMKSYRVQIAMGNEAILFYGMTPIASGKTDTIVPAQKTTVRIKAVGGHHSVWVNGVQVIDSWDYRSFSKGSLILQTDDGPMGGILDYSLKEYVHTKSYPGTYTEDQLLGVNDFDTNPNSLGGSATSHPSKIGHAAYLNAMWPLIEVTKAVQ
uniref:GDSL-type esterase/lipase family protein n=1 Tax=Pseudomonas fluorescens TaxID=294 RepID=UPI00130E3097|nr:GDSL-type esterase/lipase family protein [Pseudomonas fluorescens]